MHTKTWSVEILITEDEGASSAQARLHSEPGATPLTGHGKATRGSKDAEVPEIGEEIAAARALADLAKQLLGAASDDISVATHEDVVLDH